MATPGRNDPCHCGSGMKYKKCCAAKDAAAMSERLAKTKARIQIQQAEHRAQLQEFRAFHKTKLAGQLDDEDDTLTTDSNAVLDLIKAGEFDRAEVAAHALLERYPEVHDGYTRLGKVFEARGDRKQAADWYRKSVRFMRERPDWHDPEFIEAIEQRVQRLQQ